MNKEGKKEDPLELNDFGLNLARGDSEVDWNKNMTAVNKKIKKDTFAKKKEKESVIDNLFGHDNNKLSKNEQQYFNTIMKEQKTDDKQELMLPFLNLNKDKSSDIFRVLSNESHQSFIQYKQMHHFIKEVSNKGRTEQKDDNENSDLKEFQKNLKFTNVFLPLKRFKSSDSNTFNITRIESALMPIFNPEATSKIVNNLEYKNLKHFGKLLELLKSLFTGTELNADSTHLNDAEKIILRSIIQRKYKKTLNLELKSFHLRDELISITQITKNKRPEEKNKFVFKRCLKYMKNQLKMKLKRDNVKITKREFEK